MARRVKHVSDELVERRMYQERKAALLTIMQQASIMMDETREGHPGTPIDRAEGAELDFALVDDANPRQVASDEVRQLDVCMATLESLASAFLEASDYLVDGSWDNDAGSMRNVQMTFPDEGYPWRNAARVLLEQTATDLNILQQAVQQRRRPMKATRERFGLNLWQTMSLRVADNVAQTALRPACSNGILDKATAVCYMGPRYDIRLVPYHPVLLVGIPYTSLPPVASRREDKPLAYDSESVPEDAINHDYLAISHEVGHHVYRYGKVPGDDGTIQQNLDRWFNGRRMPDDDWRRRWLEEVFADVYGCLVAGPVAVLAFQQYLRGRPRHGGRTQELGVHPFYELRPLAQTHFLRRIRDKRRNAPLFKWSPDILDDRWLDILGYDPRDEYFVVGPNLAMPGEAILQALNEVADLILDTVDVLRPEDSQSTWSQDLQKTGSRSNVHVLMQDFQNHYRTWQYDPVVASLTPTELSEGWQDRIKEISRQSVAWDADEWVGSALAMLGWSTEGGAGSPH